MAAAAMVDGAPALQLVLVAHRGEFGLPTACPICLPVFLYLRLAKAPFCLEFQTNFPDADHLPFIEYGDSVAFNDEKGGVIEFLKEDKIIDLNSKHPIISAPDLVSVKAMVNSWLADAAQYEMWIPDDGRVARKIYCADLPWPLGKLLHWKKTRDIKQQLGITILNAEQREEEIYQNASSAYGALSLRLGDGLFFFGNRATDVDALFLGHALFVLHALPDTSVLRNKLSEHENLVKYAERLKDEFLEGSSSWSVDVLTSTLGKKRHTWGSCQRQKAREEPTEEVKKLRRRGKYFLAAQLVAVVIFLSLMGGGEEDQAGYEEAD